jgi:hypothetical protein
MYIILFEPKIWDSTEYVLEFSVWIDDAVAMKRENRKSDSEPAPTFHRLFIPFKITYIFFYNNSGHAVAQWLRH